DHEAGAPVAATAGQQLRERKDRGKFVGLRGVPSEHHQCLTRQVSSVRRRTGGADDQVIDAVAVDVACRAYSHPRIVFRLHSWQHEALGPVAASSRQQRSELECGGKARGTTENYISPIRPVTRDDEIVETVSIDIPGADRLARKLISLGPLQYESGAPI